MKSLERLTHYLNGPIKICSSMNISCFHFNLTYKETSILEKCFFSFLSTVSKFCEIRFDSNPLTNVLQIISYYYTSLSILSTIFYCTMMSVVSYLTVEFKYSTITSTIQAFNYLSIQLFPLFNHSTIQLFELFKKLSEA